MQSKKIIFGISLVCLIFLAVFYGKYVKKIPDVMTFISNSGTCGYHDMHLDEAMDIASKSECGVKGTVRSWGAACNGNTGDWKLSFSPKDAHSNCGSVCIVNTATKQAQINWMCTGGLKMSQ